MSWARESFALTFTIAIGLLLLAPFLVLSQASPEEVFHANSWRELLSDPLLQASVLRSLTVALLSAALATLVALPIALGAARSAGWKRIVLLIPALAPLAMPPFLLAATLQAGLGDCKTLAAILHAWGHLPLLVITYALHFAPVMLLGIAVGLLRLDPALAEAARCHGAGNIATWFRIVLPTLFPSVAIALIFVTIRTLADPGAPLALGARDLLAPQLLIEPTDGGLSTRGLQVAWLLTFLNALLVTIAWRYLAAPAPAAIRPPRQPRSGHLLIWSMGVAMCVVAATPMLWLGGQINWQGVMTAASPTSALVVENDWQRLLTTAATLAVIGLPTILLTQRRLRLSLLLRNTTALSLILSTSVFAMAVHAISSGPLFTDPGITGWPMVSISLAITLPFIALLPHLGAHLAVHPTAEAANLVRCFGANSGWLRLRLSLPGRLMLAAALFCAGAALSLLDVSTTVFADTQQPLPTALLFEQIRRGATPASWVIPGFALASAVFILFLIAGLLLTSRFTGAGRVSVPRK